MTILTFIRTKKTTELPDTIEQAVAFFNAKPHTKAQPSRTGDVGDYDVFVKGINMGRLSPKK